MNHGNNKAIDWRARRSDVLRGMRADDARQPYEMERRKLAFLYALHFQAAKPHIEDVMAILRDEGPACEVVEEAEVMALRGQVKALRYVAAGMLAAYMGKATTPDQPRMEKARAVALAMAAKLPTTQDNVDDELYRGWMLTQVLESLVLPDVLQAWLNLVDANGRPMAN